MDRYQSLIILFCAAMVAMVAAKPHSNLIIHHEYHGPGAPLSKDGRVLDTQEVAEAKKNHFAIYAETLADLIKKMEAARANLEAEVAQQEQRQGGEGGEQQQQQQQQQQEQQQEQQRQQGQQQQEQEQGAGEAQAEPEAARGEQAAAPETRSVTEPEAANEVSRGPIVVKPAAYEGPLAPLNEGGLVDFTPEVAKARANHLKILEEAAKRAQEAEEPRNGESGGEEPQQAQQPQEEQQQQQQQQQRKLIYLAPLHIVYTHNAPVGYHGPLAPLGYDGRVVETSEVELAKRAHLKAVEKAKSLAERNPPKPEDNNLI